VVLGRAVRGAIHSNSVRFFDSLIGVAVQLGGGAGGGVDAGDAVDVLGGSTQFGCGSAWFAGTGSGQRLCAGMAEDGAQAVVRAAGHLGSAAGAGAVQSHTSRGGCRPRRHAGQNPVVANTEPSVVKIRAIAPGCQKVLEGSGFVLSPDRVMTNAHVVAGSNNVTVEASGNPYDATVVSYDPTVDIAILSVPHLPAGPLAFANSPVTSAPKAS